MSSGPDPLTSRLESGEVRLLVSLQPPFLGYTYDPLTLQQKYA